MHGWAGVFEAGLMAGVFVTPHNFCMYINFTNYKSYRNGNSAILSRMFAKKIKRSSPLLEME